MGLENILTTPIDTLWDALFLLLRIKVYKVLHILFIASSILIAFSFLALNLKTCVLPLCALHASVGKKKWFSFIFNFLY